MCKKKGIVIRSDFPRAADKSAKLAIKFGGSFHLDEAGNKAKTEQNGGTRRDRRHAVRTKRNIR